MQIWNSAALWLLLWCVTLNNIKLIPCFYLVLALSFIAYSTECWFINVNSFLLLFSFYLVLAFLFVSHIFWVWEFGIPNSRIPNSMTYLNFGLYYLLLLFPSNVLFVPVSISIWSLFYNYEKHADPNRTRNEIKIILNGIMQNNNTLFPLFALFSLNLLSTPV